MSSHLKYNEPVSLGQDGWRCRAHQVCLKKDGKLLLENLTFDLRSNGITILLGHNGAGKSMTLRLLHGLDKPTSGEIIWQKPDRVEAMVFQKPVLFRRSVKANMDLVRKLSPRHQRQDSQRRDEILTHCGLLTLGDRAATSLSGGEAQKLAIARAWYQDPDIFFLDEPTASLDPTATLQIEKLLEILVRERRKIVFSTHDLSQARRLGGQVLFFYKGKLLEDRPADVFFKTPHTMEAKSFLEGRLQA